MAETQHSADSFEPQGHRFEPQGHRHEQSNVSIRPIAIFGVGLFVLAVVSMLLMAWLFGYFAARQARLDVPPSPLVDTHQLPPEPRLQVSPAQDWQKLRAAEDAVLNSYGWVDQEAGIVRIPIDRAIELLAERGLPVRNEKASTQ